MGTVGTELVRVLSNRGIPVRAGVYSAIKAEPPRQLDPNVELVKLDFDRPDILATALTEVHHAFLLMLFTHTQAEASQRF